MRTFIKSTMAMALGLFVSTAGAEVALPAVYTQLDWISSSGTQYIMTGCAVDNTTKIDMSFRVNRYVNGAAFFGTDGWTGAHCLFNMQSNKFMFHGNAKSLAAMDVAADWTVHVENGNVKMAKNGDAATSYAVTSTVSASNKELAIFAISNGTYGAPFRLYSMQIKTSDNVLQRDFVPCRNEKGEAGLWDRVNGKFYGNSGTGYFAGSDDEDVRLTYIYANGTQHIDTTYQLLANDCVDIRAYVPNPQPSGANTIAMLFGCSPSSGANYYFRIRNLSYDLRYKRGSKTADSAASASTGFYNAIVDVHAAGNTLTWTTEKTTGTLTATGATLANCGINCHIFNENENNSTTTYRGAARLYSFKVTSDGTVVRDFVPARRADGTVGLFDLANGSAFYGNQGTGADFTWGGIAYNVDGTTLKLYEGTLAAADLVDYAAVEKVGWSTLDASAVTEFDGPLTLSRGAFSIADGAVKTVTVNGTLAFKGNATLKIDANTSACDNFVATSLDLSNATAENPFMIDIANEDAGTDWSSGATLTLVAGTGLDDAICSNIRVTQRGPEELAAAIKDGDLVIRLKPAPHAIWTGAKGNSDFADVDNWEYFDECDERQSRVPDANTDVFFNDSNVPDIAGDATFVAKSLVLRATLGRDCDWSAFPATIPVSGTIDLKGHQLTVVDLPATWTAEITDTDATVYERLDYIEATGTQHIDTKYILKEADVIDARFYAPSSQPSSGYPMLLGVAKNSHWYWVGLKNGGNQIRYKRTSTPVAGASTNTASFFNTIVDIRCDGRTMTWQTATTSETLTEDALTGDTLQSFYIFSEHDTDGGQYHSKARIYSMTVTSSGTVVRDFIPVRRKSDQVLGLLDLAHLGSADANNPEFYANAGTGTFSAGTMTGVVLTKNGSATTARTGELIVNVAEGATVENTTVTLSGALKLVKEGAGTFVATKSDQTYVGGTDVRGGTLRAGTTCPGAPITPVTAYEGAVFDIGGLHQKDARPVLAGGTLAGTTTDFTHDQEQNAVIAVVSNSSVEVSHSLGMINKNWAESTLDLGGNVLALTVASGKSFWLCNADVTAGTLKLSGAGTLAIDNTSLRAAEADFDIAAKVTVAVDAEVHDWIVREGAMVSGSGTITVNGTFRPAVDTSAKYVLKDGATLYLGDRTGAWNSGTLGFSDGATITIDLGARSDVGDKGKIVAWAAKPANVTFTVPPTVQGLLQVDDEGIFLKRGLALYIR